MQSVMKVSRPSEGAIATISLALAVAVAYYVGANIGLILRFPPATPSVMWPPNAILTATLLLTPPRRWWIFLLAAFPAHLVVELGALPTSLVLALYATNCSEALVAAGGVRWLSDAPARFDTLRRMAIFIGAAVLAAPFISSFFDAGVVTAFRGESYWLVWRTRFFSNALTELTLVPAIVMVVTAGPAWIRRATPARRAESAFLAVSMVAVGLVVFVRPVIGVTAIPGAPLTPVAFLLPFLLWAAVRFGPGGASLSLLATTLYATWAGTHGRGPFAALPLAESVLALQIFLIVVAIPLVCLAALIEERRRVQEALRDRLRFEELLARLSGAFVHLHGRAVDTAFETWLRELGVFLGLDRLTLYRLTRDAEEFVVTYSWSAPGVGPVPRVTVSRDFPWVVQELLRERAVVFSRPEQMPPQAARDAESFRRRGVLSNLAIPLVASGRVLGSLSFVTLTVERTWPDEMVQRLRPVGEVFANALAHGEAEDALRMSEAMKSAILASLTSSVAVLDREGRIIALNSRRTAFAGANGSGPEGELEVGANYLDLCRNAARPGAPYVGQALAGIEGVLDRSRASFALEYAYPGPRAERWYAMSVVPLNRPEGGAVVSHTDVTERKRAEMEAERSRQELAHFMRVSTMGELTASLAHELNQPLTGILTNAQAARRFLEVTPPDLGMLREILSDIVDDDKRAGEVIRRLRDFLRKGEAQRMPLDLNTVVRDVTRLVSSDAVIRNITLALDIEPDSPLVSGDRIQLQQVLLNLLLNAMESMGESGGAERTVTVRTRTTVARTVQLSVQDSGTGVREGTQDVVFEPFYTTKPAGMGMGLSIARSIIEAHGGVIRVFNNLQRGATVEFDLPIAKDSEGGGPA
jgi:C4-dicarboxylate-specific signal transduction histidine kinase/integral membrane sensor domain MASE1